MGNILLLALCYLPFIGQAYFEKNKMDVFVVVEDQENPLWRLDLPRYNEERDKVLDTVFASKQAPPPGITRKNGTLYIDGKIQPYLIPIESRLRILAGTLAQLEGLDLDAEKINISKDLTSRGFPIGELETLFLSLDIEMQRHIEQENTGKVTAKLEKMKAGSIPASQENVAAYLLELRHAIKRADEQWANTVFETLPINAGIVLAKYISDRYKNVRVSEFKQANKNAITALQQHLKGETQ